MAGDSFMGIYSMKIQRNAMISRPKDQSVETYKSWFMEFAQRLTTQQSKIQLTETEWVQIGKSIGKKDRRMRARFDELHSR